MSSIGVFTQTAALCSAPEKRCEHARSAPRIQVLQAADRDATADHLGPAERTQGSWGNALHRRTRTTTR